MSLLVAIANRNTDKLQSMLKQQLGEQQVQVWPDIEDAAAIDMVLGWQVPAEVFSALPNLKAVSSFGAGVDGLNLDAIADHVSVTRIVDNELAADMAEYVLTQVLLHKSHMPRYWRQQSSKQWRAKRVRAHNRVGLLGYGQLGSAIAQRLAANGFTIKAWSNSEKPDTATVTHFCGDSGLNEMLAHVDYLVCVLPLTAKTRNIIDAELLAKLPAHAVLINVGRGEHVCESALQTALSKHTLGGATLDVFRQEPLPEESPLWHQENLILTPHCSALSRIETVVEQVVDNYQRLQSGQTLKHLISRERAY